MLEPNKYLFENSSELPNFVLQTAVASCFIQYQDTILLLKYLSKVGKDHAWATPGGKQEPMDLDITATLTREVYEETKISIDRNDLCFIAKRYARVPGWDYLLYLYHLKLETLPDIKLSNEHLAYIWTPIANFKNHNLLKGQEEAFALFLQQEDKKSV